MFLIRLRVPCCLSFACVVARVGTDMGLASFEFIRSIGSKSLFVVSLFLLCLFGESSHLTISCCVHRIFYLFFRIFHIDWLMSWWIVGLVDCLLGCFIDWLSSCLTGWLNDFIALNDWSIDRLLACLIDWLIEWLMGWVCWIVCELMWCDFMYVELTSFVD